MQGLATAFLVTSSTSQRGSRSGTHLSDWALGTGGGRERAQCQQPEPAFPTGRDLLSQSSQVQCPVPRQMMDKHTRPSTRLSITQP